MSKKVRRTQDLVQTIIDNTSTSYSDAVSQYQDYITGSSPLNITYYQISDEASRTDTSLEATREVVGSQSSLYYNRIKDVQIYCQDYQDIVIQTTQRGREAFINGEFIMIPDLNISPKSGEFICFNDSVFNEVATHLYQITDVQFDRTTSQKFYKCTFKLFNKDKDTIDPSRVVGKYIYLKNGPGNTSGVGDSVLITEEANTQKEKIEELIQQLVDDFKDTYYNDAMDTFTYQKCLNADGTQFEYYWCPYIIHFLYKNDVFGSYNKEFMKEIFINDINESNYPRIYSEKAYRDSLFYAIETKNASNIVSIDNTLLEVSMYDLNTPLNLPFFSSAEKYNLLALNHKFNQTFWLGSFNWIKQDEDTQIYYDLESLYRDWHDGAFLNYLTEKGIIDQQGEFLVDVSGKIFYKTNATTLAVEDMWYIPKATSSSTDTVTPYRCDILSLLDRTTEDDDYLIEIIKQYFNNELVLDDTTISKLSNYYYENNMKNYILMPIIIYILLDY